MTAPPGGPKVPRFLIVPRYLIELQRQALEWAAASGDPDARLRLAQLRHAEQLERAADRLERAATEPMPQPPAGVPEPRLAYIPPENPRSYAAADEALVCALLQEAGLSLPVTREQAVHFWRLCNQAAKDGRIVGNGKLDTKVRRLRAAFRRVTGS